MGKEATLVSNCSVIIEQSSSFMSAKVIVLFKEKDIAI